MTQLEKPFSPKAIHFGIDYVRLAFPRGFCDPNLTKFFTGLSANSPYREVDWYDTHFVVDYTYSGLRRTIKLSYKGFPIMFIVYNGESDTNVTKISYLLDIYSTAFYIPELQRFFSLFWRDLGFKGKVTRLDLAIDLLCTPKEFLEAGYVTQFPKGAMLGYVEKTGEVETRYFGEKKSKNKRHLIRVYDKLLDSQNKEKLKLFSHYFQFENVTRVEVEIRSLTCKELNIKATDLGDVDFLEDTFKTLMINESGTCFNAFKHLDLAQASKIVLDRKKSEIPMSRLEISKRLLGMAQSLHTAGADPIGYLIENFTLMGVYQNPNVLQKLQQSVHNAEVAVNSYPGFRDE